MRITRTAGTMMMVALFLPAVCVAGAESYRYDAHGKRDPFTPLLAPPSAEKRNAFPPLKEVVAVDELRLEGIASGRGGTRTAIVNGEMVREQMKYGDLKVLKITDRTAVILLGGKEHTLKLPQE